MQLKKKKKKKKKEIFCSYHLMYNQSGKLTKAERVKQENPTCGTMYFVPLLSSTITHCLEFQSFIIIQAKKQICILSEFYQKMDKKSWSS